MSQASSYPSSDVLIRRPGSRILFVDFFRVIAVFLMVQGHVFRALAGKALQATGFWNVHEFIHGFTAPIFLFGSGLIFMVVTRGHWEEYTHFDTRLWKRLRRYIYFLVVGYWLHLPIFSLSRTVKLMNAQLLTTMTVVDVLHVISLGLILLNFICMIARKPKRMIWILLPLAAASIALAPLITNAKIPGPAPLVSWLTTQNGSPFTILPWWGYIFFGAAMGSIFPETSRLKDERRFVLIALAVGCVLLAAGVVTIHFRVRATGTSPSWSPEQSLLRIGGVMILMCFAWLMERVGVARRCKAAFFLSEDTLIAYVTHLILVYGSVLGPGIEKIIGPTLGIWGLLIVFAGVSIVTVAFTYSWNWLKKENLKIMKILQTAMAAAFLAAYCLRPL